MSYDIKNNMATVVSTIGRLLGSRRGEEWVFLEEDIVLTRCLTRGLHHLGRASSGHAPPNARQSCTLYTPRRAA